MRRTIIACALTALAVGAGSATAATLITSSDIADGTIMNRDIHKGTISLNRLDGGVQGALTKAGTPGPAGKDGAGGANGKDGAKGDTGAQGVRGAAGVSGYEVKTYDYIGDSAAGTGAIATVACSPGKVATGGGYFFRHGADDSAPYDSPNWAFRSPAGTDGTAVIASFPGRMNWDTFTVKPGDNTGWIVQVNSASAEAHDLTVYVVCVNA
jgi:collagen type I/II/III/V/XI/XXIV/XXVII alpha